MALPAIFSLAGIRADEGCVIERTETQAHIHDAPIAAANHWMTPGLTGDDRGNDSAGRHCLMTETITTPLPPMAWLHEPVLNMDTRLAVEADASAGLLRVRGFEVSGPATRLFDLGEAAG